MPNAKESLLEIIRETRALLALPDNDLRVVNLGRCSERASRIGRLHLVHRGWNPLRRLQASILFAPTADIQEVSMSSGWDDEFCRVAKRFDAAFAQCESVRNA